MSAEPVASEETMSFQAEVSRLLDIVAHSLYSDKEIFLRELISNASDACDKLRYAAQTRPELMAGDSALKIRLRPDSAARHLLVEDNGIGMGRHELIDNLGTIARSGTAAFLEQMAAAKSDSEASGAAPSLIGQFGVGFYASFMVADHVSVLTRKADEHQIWHWHSDGKGAFTIREASEEDFTSRGLSADSFRGTSIALHLKEDAQEFLEPHRIEHIVKRYSDHIGLPIELVPDPARAAEDKEEGDAEAAAKAQEPQVLNTASALWTRPKNEISEEQYTEFYRHVSHGFGEPWSTIHFHVEGMQEFTGLIFVPSERPFDLFDPERKSKVKLYVKRVFITDDCPELIPAWLRFLRGVVDTEDLPLNVSRELLQNNPALVRMRKAIVKRVLDALKKKAADAPEEYVAFWDNFGTVLKEGIYEYGAERDDLMNLARFRSTLGEGWVSLAEYVERMKPGQDKIYYLAAGGNSADLETLRRSPQLEGFLAKGVEVLFMTDPVDEFWLQMVGSFQEKTFHSITRGGTELDKVEGGEDKDADKDKDAAEADKQEAPKGGLDAVIAGFKVVLGEEVKDVRSSDRLTESPVCLVADAGDMDMNLERLLRQTKQFDQAVSRVMEINPKHALIRALAERLDGKEDAGNDPMLDEVAHLLFDQARILEGEPVRDPAAFSRRLATLMEKGLRVG